MAHAIERSVVRLDARSGKDWGAAFFVGGRYLLTCRHVAEDGADAAGNVQLAFEGLPDEGLVAWTGEAFVVASEDGFRETIDIALLELTGEAPEFFRALTLGDEGTPSGRELRSYGFPSTRSGQGAPAVATCIGRGRDPQNGRSVLELVSQQLSGGYSGAPILCSETGQVVGVMTATVNPDERNRFVHQAWAVPCSSIAVGVPEITVARPLLIRDLLAFASERAHSLFDYVLGRGALPPDIEPRLRQRGRPFESDPVSLLASLLSENAPLTMIVGSAGSGKSSLLRAWLARLAPPHGFIPLYVSAASLEATVGSWYERLNAALVKDRFVRFSITPDPAALRTALEDGTMRFLVMVDGLDEVLRPTDRSRFVEDLEALSRTIAENGNQLVVTSRPIEECDRLEELAQITAFEILPFEEESRNRYLAEQCGDAAPALIERLDAMPSVGQAGLPLFLALTIVAFMATKEIPRSPLALLERYMEIAWSRADPATRPDYAEATALLSAIGGEAANAVPLTEDLCIRAGSAATRLANPNLPLSVANQVAKFNLDSVVGAGLGLQRDGSALRWIHGVFRDYFGGLAAAGELVSADGRTFAGRWIDASTRPTLLFALASLSRGRDIEPILVSVLASSGDSTPSDGELEFVIDLILTGAELKRELLVNLTDVLILKGVEEAEDFESCKRVFLPGKHAFKLLLELRTLIPGVEDRIIGLIDNSSLPAETRRRLSVRLARADLWRPKHGT